MKAAQCIMAIIEEGKAAKRSDSFLDYISKMKAEHDDKIASLDWRIGFAFITISELAKTATDEQVEILLDLCKVLHDGMPHERDN